MSESATLRPFYSEFAWAYDLLIDSPVERDCNQIASWLAERHVYPGSRLLDAGCGTGRYAVELARRGYVVCGIDAHSEMIRVAQASVRDNVTFELGDMASRGGTTYDAVLCRGVLNDPTPPLRLKLFDVFASSLRPGGVLIADVREWTSSADRKRAEPLFRKRVVTERGLLTFTSITALHEPGHRLLISERHTILDDQGERSVDFEFVMHCWTSGELLEATTSTGFINARLFGAYQDGITVGATDRLVVVATRDVVEGVVQ
jgi:SAM-dependent methyltransferase